jgi:biopolymer transport protein ExbD
MQDEFDDEKLYDEINITPMLDVAYVLLLIFIIMTTATVQGISIALPHAGSPQPLARPKTKAISITQDGRVFIDTFPVTLEELESRLQAFKARNPDLPVVLKADADVPYQRVVDVLDILSELEISQIGLVTQGGRR